MKVADHPVIRSFPVFVGAVWKHLGLPKPTPVQRDFCEFLQHGPRRVVAMAFRGMGKSWITSAFVCWLLLRNPQLKILVVSASKERSDAFSIFTKRLISEMPILQHLRPTPDQRQSSIAFDVGPSSADHAPSVKSVGINGQIVGSRADIIIADDTETNTNTLTQHQRDKLWEAVKEFDSIIKPGATTKIVYLGTPQCEMSLYKELRLNRGYTARVWSARYPNPKQILGYQGTFAPMLQELLDSGKVAVGDPTDPLRFTDEDLLEREASYGRSGFALQFMLDTTLSDAERYPLRCSDILVQDLDPQRAPIYLAWSPSPDFECRGLPCPGFGGDRWYRPAKVANDWAEYTGSVMAVDPSGRGKDETTYAVVKILHGKLFLTAAGGLKGGYEDETMKALANIAKEQKVNRILTESNFGDGMFTRLLEPHLRSIYSCAVEEVHHSKQKEKRIIDTLEPVLNQHRLVVDTSVAKADVDGATKNPNFSLFVQMTRITKERGSLRHDDRLDALAMAVQYWTDSMARDEREALQDWKDEEAREAMDRFDAAVIGGGSSADLVWAGN